MPTYAPKMTSEMLRRLSEFVRNALGKHPTQSKQYTVALRYGLDMDYIPGYDDGEEKRPAQNNEVLTDEQLDEVY